MIQHHDCIPHAGIRFPICRIGHVAIHPWPCDTIDFREAVDGCEPDARRWSVRFVVCRRVARNGLCKWSFTLPWLCVAARAYGCQKWAIPSKLVISFSDLSSEAQHANSFDPPMRLRKLVPATRPLKLAKAGAARP